MDLCRYNSGELNHLSPLRFVAVLCAVQDDNESGITEMAQQILARNFSGDLSPFTAIFTGLALGHMATYTPFIMK